MSDIAHVADLFTSIARLGGATDKIPTDRVIDGVDQTVLMLEGETYGRREIRAGHWATYEEERDISG